MPRSDIQTPVAAAVLPVPQTVLGAPTLAATPTSYTSQFAGSSVNFWRTLKSEWLKFWTLRSTWWVVGLTILLMAGFALLFAGVMRTTFNDPEVMAAMAAQAQAAAEAGAEGGFGAMEMMGSFSSVTIITLGLQFAQLTVAVLGVLMITNEYSSGMIRATFSAVPKRGRVLLAKLLVLLVTTALIAIVGLALAWLATRPVLAGMDAVAPVDFGSWDDVRALLGAVLYLMAIAMLSLGIGALIRATAGGIFTVVALLMVLPMVFQIILLASSATWAQTINRFLPSVAGERIFSTIDMGGGMLNLGEQLSPWAGFLVLLAYAVLVFLVAFFLMRRRDA
jgi:ABC-2 type transport system permease protein